MTQYKTPVLDAGNLLPTARLGSGVASTSTYLRGDQSWQTVTAGQPNVPVFNLAPAETQTIASGYGASVPDSYEIVNTYTLELSNNSVFNID